MLHAISSGDATLMFKNDMPGVTAEDLETDRSKIKDNVREMIEASGDLRYDLIFEGGDAHAWITELGSVATHSDFSAFISDMMDNYYDFKSMTVCYNNSESSFNVKYGEHFKLNGAVVDTNYARYENDYVDGKIERGADVITLSFAGKSLTLNFKTGTREE